MEYPNIHTCDGLQDYLKNKKNIIKYANLNLNKNAEIVVSKFMTYHNEVEEIDRQIQILKDKKSNIIRKYDDWATQQEIIDENTKKYFDDLSKIIINLKCMAKLKPLIRPYSIEEYPLGGGTEYVGSYRADDIVTIDLFISENLLLNNPKLPTYSLDAICSSKYHTKFNQYERGDSHLPLLKECDTGFHIRNASNKEALLKIAKDDRYIRGIIVKYITTIEEYESFENQYGNCNLDTILNLDKILVVPQEEVYVINETTTKTTNSKLIEWNGAVYVTVTRNFPQDRIHPLSYIIVDDVMYKFYCLRAHLGVNMDNFFGNICVPEITSRYYNNIDIKYYYLPFDIDIINKNIEKMEKLGYKIERFIHYD